MNLNFKSEKFKYLICILFLFLITLTVFQYTVKIREPWMGDKLSYNWIGNKTGNDHQILTATTLKFAKNWYREDPVTLKFAMLENPKSIEFPTLASRAPYTSYLPGSIIPIYVIGKLQGNEPTPSLIMEYNLINHFLIAFFLSLIIFFFLRQIKIDYINSFLFSTLPIFLELLLPAPLYWHQNVFFSDQAVILPFVFFIFLEVIRSAATGQKLKVINIFQYFIMFYGILTDWFFVFVIFTVYIKRVFEGDMFNGSISTFLKKSFTYWAIPLIVALLYVIQLLSLGTVNQTISKLFFRTGTSADGINYMDIFFKRILEFMYSGYGELIILALFTSILIILIYFVTLFILRIRIDKNIKKITVLIGILLVPCLIQLLLFKNHTIMHEFSVLKLSIPLATIPFVLVPVFLFFIFMGPYDDKKYILRFKEHCMKFNYILFMVFLIAAALTSISILSEHNNYHNFFSTDSNNYKELGNSIQKNTQYNDIVFSPDLEIIGYSENGCSQIELTYSMKEVYEINSLEDIKKKIKGINCNFRVIILTLGYKWENTPANATLIQDGNYYYYIIDPKSLQ